MTLPDFAEWGISSAGGEFVLLNASWKARDAHRKTND
jgi:hypothetical protein